MIRCYRVAGLPGTLAATTTLLLAATGTASAQDDECFGRTVPACTTW